jgi:hypothetical protein
MKKEKKTSNESKAGKENPTNQEFPPREGIHKQTRPFVKTKKAKSHKAIQ